MNSKSRNISFDILKILGTIIVVFHHFQQVTDIQYEHGINFWGGRFYFGYVVELFFIISGILTAKYIPLIQKGEISFAKFFSREYFRLLPLMTISAIFCYFGIAAFNENMGWQWLGLEPTILGVILTCLCVNSGWSMQDFYVNEATWYISVLLICYIFFFAIVFFSNRIKISPNILFFAMTVLSTINYFLRLNLPLYNMHSIRGYATFFFGVLLYESLEKGYTVFQKALCGILCIATVTIWGFTKRPLNLYDYVFVIFAFYPCLIIAMQIPDTKLQKNIRLNRVISYLASIAFNVYIWHSFVHIIFYIVVVYFRIAIFTGFQLMLVNLLCCIIVGIISHHFIEIPTNKLIERFLNRFKINSSTIGVGGN